MIIDILIILLFFLLRLPFPNFFSGLPISLLSYKIIAEVLILLTVLGLLRMKAPLKYTLYAWHPPVLFQDSIYGILLATVLLAISLSLSNLIPQNFLLPTFFSINPFPIYLLLLLSSISEEIFYRGFLIAKLINNKISHPYIIIITSLLFGLGHSYIGMGGIIFSTIAGSLLAYTLLRYKSIFICIFAHVLYNMIAYTLQMISSS